MTNISSRKKHGRRFYLLRQLLASLIGGAVAILLAYNGNPDPHSVITKVAEGFNNSTNVYILFGFSISYLLAMLIRKYFFTIDPNCNRIGQLVFGVLQKLASNYENLLQVVIGSMLIFTGLWGYLEPQTFKLGLCVLYIIIAFAILFVAACLDQIDDQQ